MSETETKGTKNILDLTWKDAEQMKRFVTETGRILPRRITGFTSKQQRHISKVIKQARNMLLMK